MQQPPSQGDGGTAGELRSDAQHIGSSAANRVYSEADARKGDAVDQAKSVSSALQRAAGDMGEGTPDWIKSALEQGARKIQHLADTIEHKDSRQLMSEAQDFARNSPGTFLAACAAAGFAAARIFKAGSDDQGDGKRRDHPQAKHAPQSNRSDPNTGANARANTSGELV
jgi:ElaB/YqjD/DUF883 family membrane-anchored ribosome-binding protein